MTDLPELAAKVEAATEPDRELDVLIWAHKLGYEPEWQGDCLVVGIEGVVGWIDPGKYRRNFSTNRNTIGPASIPAYTASLDVAMSLAGDQAVIVLLDAIDACREETPAAWVSALPRFVTAAALRARAAIADRNPKGGDAVAAPCVA